MSPDQEAKVLLARNYMVKLMDLARIGCLALLFLDISCQQKMPAATRADASSGVTSSAASEDAPEKKIIPILEAPQTIDPGKLTVQLTAFEGSKVKNNIYPVLRFQLDTNADFATWEVCDAKKSLCENGKSSFPEVTAQKRFAGLLTATVCPCVKPERSLNPQNSCGPCSQIQTQIEQTHFDETTDRLVQGKKQFQERLGKLAVDWIRFLNQYEVDFKNEPTCEGSTPVVAPEIIANFRTLGPDQLGEALVALAINAPPEDGDHATGEEGEEEDSSASDKASKDRIAGISESLGYALTALAGAFGIVYTIGSIGKGATGKAARRIGKWGTVGAAFAAVAVYVLAAGVGSEGNAEGDAAIASILNRTGYALGTLLGVSGAALALGLWKASKVKNPKMTWSSFIWTKKKGMAPLSRRSGRALIFGGLVGATFFGVSAAVVHFIAASLQLAGTCQPSFIFTQTIKSVQGDIKDIFAGLHKVEEELLAHLLKEKR